jgi:hypothetical protein
MMADLKIQSESDQNKQFGLDADGLADKMKLESEESNVIVTDSISVTTDSRLNGTYAVNERKDKETTAAEVSAPITAYSSPPQLDEVVVTSARVKNAVKVGNGATQAISAASISKKENTDDFLNYINNNKRECRDSTGNSVHGKVVLSYRLDKAGKPINIIVEKGLNANCDEEAIKLLKDAPPAINRKPSKRNITISF